MTRFNDNTMFLAASEDREVKKKKGDGIKAILTLLQEIRDFQSKLTDAIDAQDLEENKIKLGEFNKCLEQNWDVLTDIVRGALKHQNSNETPSVTPNSVPQESKPTIMAPSIPKMK